MIPELKEKIMKQKRPPTGPDDRQKENEGKIRKKRSEMLIKMLREEYGQNIAKRYKATPRPDHAIGSEKAENLKQNRKEKASRGQRSGVGNSGAGSRSA